MKVARTSPVWWIAGAVSALAALGCWLGYEAVGPTLGARGLVDEAFSLVPLGYFFALCAVVSFAVGLAGTMARRKLK